MRSSDSETDIIIHFKIESLLTLDGYICSVSISISKLKRRQIYESVDASHLHAIFTSCV